MSSEDQIKEAFSRAKQDILELKYQISTLTEDIEQIKRTLLTIKTPTQTQENPTIQQINPTDNLVIKPQNTNITGISTGNGGVPTNKQTNQQTDTSAQKFVYDDKISHIEKVSEVLRSLDSLKKDIRTKFKKLTNQEMLVFSTIYQLEEQGFVVDYSLISSKLALSESSIRDYVQRIIKKGIPLLKSKENNKKVVLSIDNDFKKIASLSTINALRQL